MDEKRLVNKKLLRCGYTSGACAAAAAKASALMLLSGSERRSVTITLPNNNTLTLDISDIEHGDVFVKCSVIKDSGDDPDSTNGISVYASVSRIPSGIEITGGEGIGRVTLPGLDRPVGDWAINTVPRRMIEAELRAVLKEHSASGGLSVELSVPNGRELAERTFNPRLGIVGGLSILGTTGIVEPMSDKALSESLRLELSRLAADGGERVILCPGNFGEEFCRSALGLTGTIIKCSNLIGDALDYAAELGFTQLLLVGHIGKLSKLGLGIMNTHSKNGDGRLECLAACAVECGLPTSFVAELLSCVTTDAAVELLRLARRQAPVMTALKERVTYYVNRRLPDTVAFDVICFTNSPTPAVLFSSQPPEQLAAQWRQQ